MNEGDMGDQLSQRGDRLRLGGIAIFLLFTFALVYSLDFPSLDVIKEDVRRVGYLAPLVFTVIYAAASLFFVPKNLMSIAAGAVFGMIPAMLFVLAGATLGSVIAFIGARKIGRSSVERLAGRHISRLDTHIGEKPFISILIARLIPVVPFTLLNYAAGLSAVSFIAYLGATILGMLPGTASYVALGAYGTHIRSWEFIVVILVFLGLTLLTRKLVGKSND